MQHYINNAQIAEAGKLDAVFLADNAAIVDQVHFRPITALEPTVLLASIAAATTRIGLIGSASTSYNEPHNIARRFATLDHAPLGADVIGLGLGVPLAEADFVRIHRAHLDHHVLVFRDQRITPQQQIDFSRRFGPLQSHVLHQFLLKDHPEILIVSNIVENGQPKVKPVEHPIVRTHPETGRKALFVSEHFTTRIKGLPDDESRDLLAQLFAHSVRPEHVYRHRWQPHDMVFWDNRSLMHLATGCPEDQRRRLNRTTIEGDVPF